MFKHIKKIHLAIAIVILGLLAYVTWHGAAERDLKKNGKIVQALITEYLPPGKSMSEANYRCEFKYKGKIKSLISESRIRYRQRSYVGKTFPAIYSAKYDFVRLLLTSDDALEFDIDLSKE
ncbi:MAG: hypothetical protein H7Y86_02035 [Rhizobacter sp.]|nr:hypothetical protein [Ferruginibacter sp.]